MFKMFNQPKTIADKHSISLLLCKLPPTELINDLFTLVMSIYITFNFVSCFILEKCKKPKTFFIILIFHLDIVVNVQCDSCFMFYQCFLFYIL